MKAKPVIKLHEIKDTYSGRPGCACGCRGNYSDTPRSKSIALKKYLALPAEWDVMEHFDADGNLQFVAWDNAEGTRTYTIYTVNYK